MRQGGRPTGRPLHPLLYLRPLLWQTLRVPKDPESLGTGIGPLLADMIPLLPSGARRAGAARVMAARIGDRPSPLVEHPIKTQLLALGLGGVGAAYTGDQGIGLRLAASLGPIAGVQLLRRLELKSIQKRYDKEKRKRLRELDEEKLFDSGFLGLGGSARLGAVNAYETMRKRKYQGYGSLSEAGDAIQLAGHGLGIGIPVSALVGKIDNAEATRMLKRADFSDQRNSPTIPLYLAAGLLSALGLEGSRRWAVNEHRNTPELGTDKWRETIRGVSGTNPLLFATEGRENAFFFKPRNEMDAVRFLNHARGWEDLNESDKPFHAHPYDRRMERVKQIMRHGSIVADKDAGAPTIAHEAGHAKIEETPGILRGLQRHVYPHQKWIAPLSGAGSMAAGLASGGPIRGALLGTLIGGVSGLGHIAPEAGASYHALKHLNGSGRKDLASALSTYLAFGVLPSTLSGLAGGYIAGQRKKKDEEEQEKAASKVNDVHKIWKALRSASSIRRDLGPDAADRFLIDQVGAVWAAARRGFFKRPEVQGLGLTSRSRPGTVTKALDTLKVTSSPAADAKAATKEVLNTTQGTFDFLDMLDKQAAHPALPGLLKAKGESDRKRYDYKHRLLQMEMRRDPDAFVIDSDDGKGIVGITHVPTGFKVHMLKHQVDPGVSPMTKAAADSTRDGTIAGMLAGAGLPASALADYELRQRPGHEKLINQLVNRAAREKKIWVGNSTREAMHPLKKRMQLGDIILQGHRGEDLFKTLRTGNPDFTTLSLGGSGGPFAHAGLSTRTGRIVDPGKFDYDTPLSWLLGRTEHRLRGKKWEGESWRDVVKGVRPTRGRGESVHKFLSRVSYDPFSVKSDSPEASLVMRGKNTSGISEKSLANLIAREQQLPYGRGRAVLSGAKRIFFPFGELDPALNRKPRVTCQGTYCSDGANRLLRALGMKTKSMNSVLPPDLAKTKGLDMVGIGLNRAALKGVEGTGMARKATAAKKQLFDVMASAAKARRQLGGMAIGLGALGGGALGWGLDKAHS